MTKALFPRLASIDVFRAITMLLMIFVNDLWTLRQVPEWLEHTTADADAMGLADTIFPAFLFIVGLSIPFAIQGRRAKGESLMQITGYIVNRSLALVVMGFFQVNLDGYSTEALLPQPLYQVLLTVAFFLVWLDYSPITKISQRRLLQYSGIALLIILAALYKGGEAGDTRWMTPQWWGILGLIGWAYLLCAFVYLLAGERFVVITAALLFFHLFNIGSFAGWLEPLRGIRRYIWIAGSGSMPALTMGGVLVSVIYRKYAQAAVRHKTARYIAVLLAIGLIMLLAGFYLRDFWGLSKIRATPAWVATCTGISIFVFVLLIYLVDIKNKKDWFQTIRPAGTSTLTCYLLPYIHYALYSVAGITLPMFLRTGGAGIIKSLMYALLIVIITGMLEKRRIRLKI